MDKYHHVSIWRILRENKGLMLQTLLVNSPCSDYSYWNHLYQCYGLTAESYSNPVLFFKNVTKCLMKNEWMKKDEFRSLFKVSSHLRKCLASRCCETVISSSNHNMVKYRVFPKIRLHRWLRTTVQLANTPKLVFIDKYRIYKSTIINHVLLSMFSF